MQFVFDHAFGITDASAWQMVIYTVVMIQISFMGITLYLHRDMTHRGLDMHAALRHFFRFWLWLTTGTVTKEWVAIHRKHHARVETADDPHSPVVEGLRAVLFGGYELYRAEADHPETLVKYGRGTPDDWVERKLYARHSLLGVLLLFGVNLFLFGVAGPIVFAAQMAAQPLFAAGIINGVGHHTGYRNFESEDASKNVVPWAFVIGGEELHNNHHAFPSSARFSVRPWEFDIGWLYISIFAAVGLARVRRVWPALALEQARGNMDLDNLRAIIVARMHVLRAYTRQVTLPVLQAEIAAADTSLRSLLTKARTAFIRSPMLVDERARARLEEILDRNARLRQIHEFREQLKQLWAGTGVSNERLLAQFREWCARAEASGNQYLEQFSEKLRSYQLVAA
jgi:stearoyl-CoA desaturase (Delta-9 desaturase)